MAGERAAGRQPTVHAFSLLLNPRADRDAVYGPAEREVLDRAGFEAAYREISSWPGYAPTPLVELPGLAATLGIAAIHYKDEAGRFGIGSFKALGGAYAVFRVLAGEIARRGGRRDITSADIVAGKHRDIVSAITVACATDGNHGRSVAWGARTFGCRCVVYMHPNVSAERADAVTRFGAEVVRVDGNYDESVRQAAEDAARNGWFVVSDTAYGDYTEEPRQVMQGYTVMVDEAMRQFPGGVRPTHAFVQAGVGGLAAAVCAHLWESWGVERPQLVVVEPEQADCLYQSALQGRLAVIGGDTDTFMGGLAAGEASTLAWRLLDRGADAFVTIPDAAAMDCMAMLADGVGGDAGMVAGESGVAGLAGLVAAATDPVARRDLGLGPESRVFLVGSEGDTDPELYRTIVGRSAEAVRAGTAVKQKNGTL